MAEKPIKSSFLNMFFSLTGIALMAALVLAYTYGKTKDLIEQTRLKEKKAAVNKVIPSFDNNPLKEMYTNKDFPALKFYPARLHNTAVGTAVVSSVQGFSDKIKIMAGFTTNIKIIKIVVLEQKETPGLGSKIQNSSFLKQFRGLKPQPSAVKVKKDGGNIDAITAATISSRAFCQAVQKAVNALQNKRSDYTDTETCATETSNE
ncbi:MAG TPA: RnfABCDGE type electron transport complex subunit G [Spirochaetota bacterium]|nr:RnfABCDGE type electron transport complex subunit G [Spirochaetota bacterium]